MRKIKYCIHRLRPSLKFSFLHFPLFSSFPTRNWRKIQSCLKRKRAEAVVHTVSKVSGHACPMLRRYRVLPPPARSTRFSVCSDSSPLRACPRWPTDLRFLCIQIQRGGGRQEGNVRNLHNPPKMTACSTSQCAHTLPSHSEQEQGDTGSQPLPAGWPQLSHLTSSTKCM